MSEETPTIKNILLNNWTWLIWAVAFVLGMYIHNVISPLSNRIDVLAKDVQMNTKRVEACGNLQEDVAVNSAMLHEIKTDIHDIKLSLNNSN